MKSLVDQGQMLDAPLKRGVLRKRNMPPDLFIFLPAVPVSMFISITVD
jgi:hypothetical protein